MAQPMEKKSSFIYAEESPNMKDLECHICLEPLVDPIIHSDCQVMFCKECIAPLQKCPTCDKILDHAKLAPVPKFIVGLLDSLKVKCPICDKFIERRIYKTHIQNCPVPCVMGCGEKISPLEQKNHEQNTCPNLPINCPAKESYCQWKGLRRDLAEHSKTCSFAQMAPVIQVVVDHFQTLLKQQREQFLEQVQQQKAEIVKLREDMIHNMNVSAARKKWKLTMSSKFFSVVNTYESLTDDDHCTTGVATENRGKEWIQATFEFPVLVASITVSGFKGAMFAWRADYCEGKTLQYSHDDVNWIDSLTIGAVGQGKPTKITLPSPVIARFWRIFGNGYCATATLIFE